MTAPTCPGCARPADPAVKPFCSRGCKDRDLLRWLDGGYRIAGPNPDEADADYGLDKGSDPD